MRTVRRLLYRDIVWSVVFVALAFLSLFFFIDFVDELENVGRNGYTLGQAALRGLLEQPGHFYELFPIAVLIGTIYAMARLAQSSEFTILRTGGLGPGRALRLLAALGLMFALVTFVVGDYLVPLTEQQALALKAGQRGGLALGTGGAWLKERRPGSAPSADPAASGERSISVNVIATGGGGELLGVRIFEFDTDGRLRTRIEARTGQVLGDGHWRLREVQRTEWPTPEAALAIAGGEQEVMVIGGEALYRALLPRAGRLYLTLVDTRIEDGDAFFPFWAAAEWREIEREEWAKDEANPFNLSFVSLERVLA